MNVQYEKQYILSGSDKVIIHNLIDMCVTNYIDLTTNTSSKKTASSDEQRLRNNLYMDTVFTEATVIKIFKMLDRIKNEIKNRIATLKGEIDGIPESAPNSIILRPKEAYQMLIDNYEWQLRNIEEIRAVFLYESNDVEEIED